MYVIREVVRALKPVNEICTKLCADTYVTASAVLPVLHLMEAGFVDDDDPPQEPLDLTVSTVLDPAPWSRGAACACSVAPRFTGMAWGRVRAPRAASRWDRDGVGRWRRAVSGAKKQSQTRFFSFIG